PKAQADEVLRVAPSKDPARVDAAVGVFRRFATESVSQAALAHDLNARGFRNGYGGHFQGHHVRSMLRNPAYTGVYAWNRTHGGKFHRLAGGRMVPDPNYGRQETANDPADRVRSPRLSPPPGDRATRA